MSWMLLWYCLQGLYYLLFLFNMELLLRTFQWLLDIHRVPPLFLQSPIDLLYTGSQSALSLTPTTLFFRSPGIPYQPSYILNSPISKFSAFMIISLCNIAQTTPPILYQYPLFCKIWCNLSFSFDLPRIYTTVWYFSRLILSLFIFFKVTKKAPHSRIQLHRWVILYLFFLVFIIFTFPRGRILWRRYWSLLAA